MSQLFLGIDIGGTGIKFGLVDAGGQVFAQSSIATPQDQSPAAGVSIIAAAARDLLSQADCDPASIRIGVGCAGLISTSKGIIHRSPNLAAYINTPLSEMLASELETPVRLLNDANACALAESRLGAGRGKSPAVILTIGTGVGGAIVNDGHLLNGCFGFSGEIGHMTIDWQGEKCACGNQGCLEMYVGKRPIIENYLAAGPWTDELITHQQVSGNQADLSPEVIAGAALAGESRALATYRSVGHKLGAGLTALANIFDPAIFVIGGGIAEAGDLLFDPAREVLTKSSIARGISTVSVTKAELGVEAGFIGAAFFAADENTGDRGD